MQAVIREEVAHPFWQCVGVCYSLPSSIVFWSRWHASDDHAYPDFPRNDEIPYSICIQAYLMNCSREVWVSVIAKRETALLTTSTADSRNTRIIWNSSMEINTLQAEMLKIGTRNLIFYEISKS